MALVVKDRVQVSTSTTGTGTLTLGAALGGFQDFSVIGDGNTTYYTITNNGNWEVGIGTYTASGTTLSRDTVLESSNSGSKINLSGSSIVFCTYPAEKSVDIETAQTLTNKTISADNNTLSGIAASSFVLSNASGNIDGAAAQKAIPSGVVVGTTDTQTLSNKSFASSIAINGSTSGTITVQATAVAGTTTLTLPATSGTVALTSQLPYSVDYLVVAGGGGGGGAFMGGGGGAGGYIAVSGLMAIPSTAMSVTIGAAGSAGAYSSRGSSGGNSLFSLSTALGGGGGGGFNVNSSGASGGSGGGASGYNTVNFGAGTSGQGNNGGVGVGAPNYGAGGGGGAGAAGSNGSSTNGGAGGAGLNWQSLGTFYAGGGGGGAYTGTGGAGGSGGGGAGANSNGAATDGTSNSGGGGGGSNGYVVATGANGGSGVVIIRYDGSQRGTGGTVTSSGGYTYHTFTSSGTYTA